MEFCSPEVLPQRAWETMFPRRVAPKGLGNHVPQRCCPKGLGKPFPPEVLPQGIHLEKPHFLKNPRFELKSLLGPGLDTLLDLFWEGIWPPSHWKSVSKEPWGRPRADPNYFFGRQMQKWMLTWRVLERSRTLSGGQGAPRCLWAAIWDHLDVKTASRSLQPSHVISILTSTRNRK